MIKVRLGLITYYYNQVGIILDILLCTKNVYCYWKFFRISFLEKKLGIYYFLNQKIKKNGSPFTVTKSVKI